jgi:hypothetical protein
MIEMYELPSIWHGAPVATPVLWYLAMALLLLTAVWLWMGQRWRRRRRELRVEHSKAPPVASDEPVMKGATDSASGTDTLGFGVVAKAIAGLLRNRATGAPYSVVISGNWGSGKSSVMLQIQKLLRESAGAEFITIKINVWHYQNGQHLLAGFLRKLFVACDTRPYRVSYRQFRFRNLGFRNGMKVGLALFLLSPVALYLLWLLLEPMAEYLSFDTWTLATLRGLNSTAVGHVLLAPFRILHLAPELLKSAPTGTPDTPTPELLLGGTALAWLGTLVAGLRAVYTYGDVMTELVPLRQFDQEIKVDAGFRDDFRKQLLEVLQHAPPATRLVFFVDDVDRIPGSRVQELLESLSFLVEACREARDADPNPDSGARLYFVLGMYVPEVVKTLADALNPSLMPRTKAHRHAARYLEKLVDLVVPMPTLDQCAPKQIQYLLFGDETPAQP